MPLIKSKSKRAFEHNVKAEMHAGKPQDQSLAISYAVKRKAKKASGGAVQSGSKDMNMAEGGEISANNERRPMPDNKYHDAVQASHNDAKKQLIDSNWTGRPTVSQAQSNNGRQVKPIKHPRMVPSDAFSARLRDEESDLQSAADPGPYGEQPPQRDNEERPNRQGPDNVDRSKPHSGPKAYAKGGMAHGELAEDEMHLQDSESPSEDEGSSNAKSRNEAGADRQGPPHEEDAPHSLDSEMYHDDMANEDHEMEENPARFAEGGHIGEFQDNYADDGHEDSIAAAIMSKKERERARLESGSMDMDKAVRMALGGELLEDDADIHSHGSTDSDDSDQADLSRNADEDANEEDQLSFDALRKENYSESEGLRQLDYSNDSDLQSDDEEMNSHDRNDRVSAIRSRMSKRQF